MSLAPTLVSVATIVAKIEALGIHVIEAAVSHHKTPSLGIRITVRGGNTSLVVICDLVADSVVDPIRFTGRIGDSLLVTNVMIDGLTVHLTATG